MPLSTLPSKEPVIQRLPHPPAVAALSVAPSSSDGAPAHASGSSMPWEAPLQSILESIEGPVAKIVAVIIII
jgi:type IV secretion system protein VirB2